MSASVSDVWLFYFNLCCYLLALTGGTAGQAQGVRVVVEEDSDAVLPCSINPKEDITGMLFDWKKDGQKDVFMYNGGIHHEYIDGVSPFRDQLKNGNASIKIKNVKPADSGNYTCIFPHLWPIQTFNIELVVGASKPLITTLDQTKDWSLLQCEVQRASPEPKVEWQDSSGNILPAEERQVSERGGRYYVTINTTVTKTGRYCCEVTQEEISHQINAEIYVFICEKLVEDQTTKEAFGWLAVGFVLGAAVLAAVLFGLRATKRITVSFNRGADPDPTTTNCYPCKG